MPGAQVVGIQIDVHENASVVGPRVAQVFENIGDAGQQAGASLQDAFDFSKLSSQLEGFAEKVDRLYETKLGKQRELQTRYMELRNQTMEQKLNTPEERAIARSSEGGAGSRALMTVSRAGSAVAQAGETGNAIGPGANILESLGGAVSKAGPVGAGIAAVAGVVSVTAVITDQLTKTYEAFVPTIMDTTAALGQLGKSAGENSIAFRKNLREAADAASQFGYSIETGNEVMSKLAHGGVGGVAATRDVLAYARGFGVSPGDLTNAKIMAATYDKGSNVLGLTAGGVGIQGIGSGRYEEYLNALTSAMEDAVGKGVSRSFEDISGSLNFFSRLGPMWQGQVGAQKVAGLNQALAGATGLQSETDVILYRAAKAEAVKSAKGQFDYIDVMQRMEQGMTVGMFKQIYDQVKQMTGGSKTDMIEMLRQTFGVNYSMASSLYQAGAGGGGDLASLVAKLPPPTAESDEMKLTKQENMIRMAVIEAGETLLPAKTEIVSSLADVVKLLSKIAGVDLESQTNATRGKATREAQVTASKEFRKNYEQKFIDWGQTTSQTLPGQQFVSELSDIGIGGANGALIDLMSGTDTVNQDAAAKLMTALQGLNPTQIGMLSGGKYGSQMQGILASIGNKDRVLQSEETGSFYQEFQPILAAVTKEAAGYTSKAPAVGSLAALSRYTMGLPEENPNSLQAVGRYGLQQLMDQLTDLQRPRKKGLFGESDETYSARLAKAQKLEDALTGLTPGQVEGLISSGSLGEMYAKNQLSTKDVDALIKALKDNTAALNAPATVTVQSK
ncbi:MAG: hypothetical protein C4K49_10555 [Candidatus Thorarchaeota archaeon]|nr:MAG: hypothetical protein C4K49_10555 [Candidatus Thorarchaeota archaeon]